MPNKRNDPTKPCKRGHNTKFMKRRPGKNGDGYFACYACAQENLAVGRQKHKKRTGVSYEYKYKLKKAYNLTIEDYSKMFKEHSGLCSICQRPETTLTVDGKEIRKLSVDHDHFTGKIRGLLCTKCNTAIGAFDDNIDRLLQAARYLRQHGSQ